MRDRHRMLRRKIKTSVIVWQMTFGKPEHRYDCTKHWRQWLNRDQSDKNIKRQPMLETTTRPADTFPRLLQQHARMRPGRPAFREKDLGIWQTTTWSQLEQAVTAFACGLAALGFRRGMNLAVVGDNRPRLYWAMAAAQSLGGVAVPLYQDAPAADMAYVLENAGIDFAVVEDRTSSTTIRAVYVTTRSPACTPSTTCKYSVVAITTATPISFKKKSMQDAPTMWPSCCTPLARLADLKGFVILIGR